MGDLTTSPKNPSNSRKESIISISLFLTALCVYIKTLCPTIFADDGGEITTAVATGGVMHPPGYPLYSLLGGMFIHLIHFGEPAWRLGLVSAVAGAGAVALIFLLARLAGASITGAVTSALAFAFSVCLWQQSTKVETYALNALFVVLILITATRYSATGLRRDLVATAFCCGLALTNHLTVICAIAGAIWLIGVALKRDDKPLATTLAAVVAFVLPLSLYAFIWIAAQSHVNGEVWGDPSNLHRFLLHVTAARYHGYLLNQTSGAIAQRDLIDLPALLWHNIGWFLIGVVPGVARGLLMPKSRCLHQAMLIAGAAYFAETSAYGIENIFEYYTPVILLLCVWGGVGMDGIISGLTQKIGTSPAFFKSLPATCCALLTLTALLAHWSACDRSKAVFIRDFALNTLRNVPQNGVLVAAGDNRIFPIWYVQEVLGVRRDVTLVPRQMMESLGTSAGRSEMGWLVAKMGSQHPDLIDSRTILSKCSHNSSYAVSDGPTWDIVSRALNTGHMVMISDIARDDTSPGRHRLPVLTHVGPNLTLTPIGLMQQVVPLRSYPNLFVRLAQNLAMEKQMNIDMAPDALMQDEPDKNFTNIMYARMLTQNGDLLLRAKDLPRAYTHLRSAALLDPTSANLSNLAYVSARMHRTAEAVKLLKTALSLDPENEDYQEALELDQRASASPSVSANHG